MTQPNDKHESDRVENEAAELWEQLQQARAEAEKARSSAVAWEKIAEDAKARVAELEALDGRPDASDFMLKLGGWNHGETAGQAIQRHFDALGSAIEGVTAHRDGLYRVFQALAEDDRPRLSQVDERIQADVDAVVAERIALRGALKQIRDDNGPRMFAVFGHQGPCAYHGHLAVLRDIARDALKTLVRS